MVLWAANFIVVKTAVAQLPPVGFTFLRFTLASVTLLVLLRWREGSIGLPRRDLIAILALGAVGFGAYQILWTTGLTTVPAGDSALLIAATSSAVNSARTCLLPVWPDISNRTTKAPSCSKKKTSCGRCSSM